MNNDRIADVVTATQAMAMAMASVALSKALLIELALSSSDPDAVLARVSESISGQLSVWSAEGETEATARAQIFADGVVSRALSELPAR